MTRPIDDFVRILVIEMAPYGNEYRIEKIILKIVGATTCMSSMYAVMPVAGRSCQVIALPAFVCQGGAWTFWGSAMTWSNWKLIDALYTEKQGNEPPLKMRAIFTVASIGIGVLMECYLPYFSYVYGGNMGFAVLSMLANSGYPSYSSYLIMCKGYEQAQAPAHPLLKQQMTKLLLLGLVHMEQEEKELKWDEGAGAAKVFGDLILLAKDSLLLESMAAQDIREWAEIAAETTAQVIALGRYGTDALFTHKTLQTIFQMQAVSIPLSAASVAVTAYLTHHIVGKRASEDISGIYKHLREATHFKKRRWNYLGSAIGKVGIQAASLLGLSTTLGFVYDQLVVPYAGGWNWWTGALGVGEGITIGLFLSHVSLDMYKAVASRVKFYLGGTEDMRLRLLHCIERVQDEEWKEIYDELDPEARALVNDYLPSSLEA